MGDRADGWGTQDRAFGRLFARGDGDGHPAVGGGGVYADVRGSGCAHCDADGEGESMEVHTRPVSEGS